MLAQGWQGAAPFLRRSRSDEGRWLHDVHGDAQEAPVLQRAHQFAQHRIVAVGQAATLRFLQQVPKARVGLGVCIIDAHT